MSVHVVAGGRLKRALEASAEDAGCTIDFAAERTRPYLSALYVGGRHHFTAFVPFWGHEWLDQLDDESVLVPGYLLAQLEVGSVEARDGQLVVEIEAVTIKEA